jgi:hypothetical protein
VIVFGFDPPEGLDFGVLLVPLFLHAHSARLSKMVLLRALGVHGEHRKQPFQVLALT